MNLAEKHVTYWLHIMDKPNQTDLVFQALASRPRRMIMDLVKQMPGCSVNDICEHFEISRIGVMKHLNILVDAKILISRKRGRTRELFFNAAPIQMIYDRWTDEYSQFWTTQVLDLKYNVEGKKTKSTKMDKPPSKTKRTKKKSTKQRKTKGSQ